MKRLPYITQDEFDKALACLRDTFVEAPADCNSWRYVRLESATLFIGKEYGVKENVHQPPEALGMEMNEAASAADHANNGNDGDSSTEDNDDDCEVRISSS